MKKELKGQATAIRFKPSVIKMAKEKALSQNRSVSNYIEWLIIQDNK